MSQWCRHLLLIGYRTRIDLKKSLSTRASGFLPNVVSRPWVRSRPDEDVDLYNACLQRFMIEAQTFLGLAWTSVVIVQFG